MEDKRVTEISDAELQSVDGGAAVYNGHRITTGITGACGDYSPGSNFYNRKILAVNNTCGACTHMMSEDGWHLCGLHSD
ncbi:hypothetical protein NXH76_28380 [Blautia schinkii]|nr:hypothetical protein [Blautia schinkii]